MRLENSSSYIGIGINYKEPICNNPFHPLVRWILAISSGLLLVLSFPRPGWYGLAWFALIPLLLVLATSRPRAAFGYGFLTGLSFFLVLIRWIGLFGSAPWLALSAIMALYSGIFGALTAICYQRKSAWARILIPAMIWATFEWIRSLSAIGFTWGTLGYSQSKLIPLIQIASLTGPYGISFLILIVNTAFADLLLTWTQNLPHMEGPLGQLPRSAMRILAVILLVIGTIIWGSFYKNQSLQKVKPSPTLETAIIQGNRMQEQDVIWTHELVQQTVDTYINLSRKSLKAHPRLIIWPETAIPEYVTENPELLNRIQSFAKETKTFLLVGGSHRDEQDRIYNSMFLFSPEGKLLGRYDKVHLVPFGEFVPWRNRTHFFERWPIRDFDYSSGSGFRLLKTSDASLGVSICFESVFPQISRSFTKKGANLLVIVTNDAWYGRSPAAAQHAQMAVFRAVENRRVVLRAATSGISAVISPDGVMHHATGLYEERIITDRVATFNGNTLYTRVGDLFAMLCGVFSVIVLWRRPR